MKKIILLLLCFLSLNVFAQGPIKFDPAAWKAPYYLPLEGWGIERFPMPIDFAPSIPYKGVEDIRFAPGWGESDSENYWTYAFLWYIEGNPTINAETINGNLNAYYDGLISRNIEKRNIPANMVTKTKTNVHILDKAQENDQATYSGRINMLDYMGKKPIGLNCMIHVAKCPGTDGVIIFHQLSPKPFTDPAWVKLKKLWTSFDCKSK